MSRTDIREQFAAIRRAYRCAQKLNILADEAAMMAKISATSALRAFTGKLDTCEPPTVARQTRVVIVNNRKRWVSSPVVWAACTRWLKTH